MKKLSLTNWIFIGMAAGVLIGAVWPDVGKELQPASNVFLRLIKSIIAPLLFGTLVCLIPSKVKMQYVRTEVVGYAEKHATVTK